MTLEEATHHDIPAIAALMNLAYRGSGEERSWNSEDAIAGDRTSPALIAAEMAAEPEGRFLVVHGAEGDLAGCVWLKPVDATLWYLGSLAIPPRHQQGGGGRALLGTAEDWVCERGGRRVRLTVVNVRAPLIAWYERRGYALTGETEPFPYGDDRFGVPTRPDLCFVVLEKELAAG